MSRAFVSEDSTGPDPAQRYRLPGRADPGFAAASARALIQGANEGDSAGAEEATGYSFGAPDLVPFVLELLETARREQNDRMEQLTRRFLLKAGYQGPALDDP